MSQNMNSNVESTDNNGVSTHQLWKNLNFLWENGNVIDPATRRKYTKQDFIIHFLRISQSTYDNYRNGRTPANRLSSLDKVVSGANNWIEKDDGLKALFAHGLLKSHLIQSDLFTQTLTQTQTTFYPQKIIGTYLCYYNATHIDDTKQKSIQYGVMQIVPSANGGDEYSCKGVFSLKDFKEAKRIHDEIEENEATMEDITPAIVFKGKAYIKRDLIWVAISNETKSEFVSISFDIDPKVLEKNPSKTFKGVRGLALSQSSGIDSLSVVFPVAIKRTPIQPSKNELRKYLTFEHKKVDDNSTVIKELTTNVIGLIDSISSMSIAPELRHKLVAKMLASGIETILETDVYNSYYYSSHQISRFYHEIISPDNDD